MVMEATAPPTASPPGDEWRVLSSGALAYRLPPTKEGKPIWLDALQGVKLCEHGHSAAQIHHWRCAARPRAKPDWVTCTCPDAKGLCMEAAPGKAPMLPADAPEYHRVLWRDAEPVLLQPNGQWGVRVPGKPKGHDVFLAANGTPLCAHGFSASELAKRRARQRVQAASKIQAWWRAMDRDARASVRAAMLHSVVSATASMPPSHGLRRAAAVWRTHSEWRRIASRQSNPWARPRGRPPTRRADAPTCRCSTAGLRIDRLCPEQRGRRKRPRAHAPPLVELVDAAGAEEAANRALAKRANRANRAQHAAAERDAARDGLDGLDALDALDAARGDAQCDDRDAARDDARDDARDGCDTEESDAEGGDGRDARRDTDATEPTAVVDCVTAE